MKIDLPRVALRAALCVACAAAVAAGFHASADDSAPARRAAGPRGAEFDTEAVKALAASAERLSLDEQIALLRRVRHVVSARLLAPPERLLTDWSDLRDRTDAGVVRLIDRRFADESLVPARGGGCYWSFTRRSHSYGEHPQIELQNGKLSSGFYGGAVGMVAVVTGTSLRDLTEAGVPAHFAATQDEVRKVAARGDSRADAKVGAVYVVRTHSTDEFDVLAAFQVLEIDDLGATLAWRVLRTWDAPTRAR